MKRLLTPLLALIGLELACFGVFSSRLGFYHDDWFFLEQALRGGGFWGVLKIYSHIGNFLARPVNIVHFALFYEAGGFNPAVYQLLLLALDVAQGFFFFIVIERLIEDRALALLAAALGMICPSRVVMHLWYSNSPQGAALACVFAGLAAHQLWLERRRGAWLWAGQGCYLLSMLNYESGTFLPLLLAAGLLVKARRAGAGWIESADRTLREMFPFALTLMAALAWQWIGVKTILHQSNQKSFTLSFHHVLKAFGAAFECVSNRVIHICWTGVPGALHELNPGYAFLALAAALAAAWLVPAKPSAKKTLLMALALAAAAFVGGYLPYALSGNYVPQIYGLMSRTNGGGAWVTGLLLACAIQALPGAAARRTLLAAAVAVFTLTDWHAASQWVSAWELEQDILAKAAPLAARLPRNSTVLLAHAPGYIGHAIVFDATWAFAPALRMAAKRDDLIGDVASAEMTYDKSGLIKDDAEGSRRYSYDNLYVFDYGLGTLSQVTGPPKP